VRGQLTPLITAPEPVVRAVDIHNGSATLLVSGAGSIFRCTR